VKIDESSVLDMSFIVLFVERNSNLMSSSNDLKQVNESFSIALHHYIKFGLYGPNKGRDQLHNVRAKIVIYFFLGKHCFCFRFVFNLKPQQGARCDIRQPNDIVHALMRRLLSQINSSRESFGCLSRSYFQLMSSS
jgi:hypothetical protein